MLNIRRFILPITVTVLLAATTITIFKFYREKTPFYVRLTRRKKYPYKLQNARITESALVADVTKGNYNFSFNLSFLSDEIVHMQINDTIYSRYVVQDVIKVPSKITIENVTMRHENCYLHIDYRNFNIKIKHDDLEIHIYKNNNLFLSINSEKTFVIEEQEPQVAIAADFHFPNAVKAYGLPEHAERLCLQADGNKLYRLYNTDRFAYSTTHPHESLYGAVPLIYAYGTNQTTGLLWLNSSETFIDIQNKGKGLNSTFFSESGAVDFYVLSGPTLQDVVRQNSQLTGAVPLPPLFALGYHQSRFSYMTQEEVIEVSNMFDEYEFPLDSLWMDIDYTDGKKYFTWNPMTYANPEQLLKFIENKKRKAVVIIDPHIKVDDDYFVYAQCKKGDFLVKNPNGTIFTAKCWPGNSSWIDFLNPKARRFYSDLHRDFVKSNILHIWNDMNEPALFEIKENAMPKNVLHYDNWKHRDVHNLYGFYQTMATYEGLLNRSGIRPFVLTRAHFAGSQRFGAVWTGDNTASWDHLKISVPMCLTASLAGFSLCGADVGGFVKHPDDELLQRWYQLGAWLPFFRGHSNRNVPRREPYLYSKSVQKRIRFSLQQRYTHLLHWYTLFWEHSVTLKPVVRALIYQYPDDKNVWELDNEFLVGESILVCPVLKPRVEVMDVYLPGGENEAWYHSGTPIIQQYPGSGYITMSVEVDTIPVFYRGGCIIPIVEHSVTCCADFLDGCSLTLCIFCDKNANATGALYMDDTQSFSYLENKYSYMRFDLKSSKISCTHVNRNFGDDQSIVIKSVKLYGYNQEVYTVALNVDGFQDDHKITIVKENDYIQIRDLDIGIQQDFVLTLLK